MAMGMKREAVQEERQRGSRGDKNGGDDEVESSSLGPGDMPTDWILEDRIGYCCSDYQL